MLRAPLITALENTDYFLAATAALEVQMFVRMYVCHTHYNCTAAEFCRTSAGLLKDFCRTPEGILKEFQRTLDFMVYKIY